jgi:hypothetical protein
MCTYNGGALDGEMRQRLRGGGRDGRERRAHDAEEEAEVGAAERPAAAVAAADHQRGTGQVAAHPLPEPVSPSGLLAERFVLGHLRALHERRQDLAARPEAAGVGDKLLRRVLVGELLGRRGLLRRRSRLAGARKQRLPPRPRR